LNIRHVKPGIDRRDDLGSPDRFDVYYGMADNRIDVARLDVPKHLPSDGLRDLPSEDLGTPKFEPKSVTYSAWAISSHGAPFAPTKS
jgi:hypothetical protein